jgi:membrane associated rhomboid family serine protease
VFVKNIISYLIILILDITSVSLTGWIIGITVIISWYAFSKPEFVRKWILNPYRVQKDNEYYRFVTSGFLHADFTHILWNMFSLYFFGRIVEQYFGIIFGTAGPYYFIAFYVLAIIISDVPSYFKHKSNPSYNSLGASGGVAAVIFASIIFQPIQNICIYFVICLPGFILGTVYVVWSYFKGKQANDNINHEAHLYGALFGIVFCLVMKPAVFGYFIDQLMSYRPSFIP